MTGRAVAARPACRAIVSQAAASSCSHALQVAPPDNRWPKQLRVVLIFDLWNPLLSDKDRKAASTLAAATRGYSMNESSSRLHSGTAVAPEKPTA